LLDPASSSASQLWSCQVCGAVVPFAAPGTRRCPGCGCPVTLKRDPRTGDVIGSGLRPVLQGALAGADGVCAAHPDDPVAGVCERCGDFLCAACTRFLDHRRYCAGCVSRVREDTGRYRARKDRLILFIAAGLYVLLCLLVFLVPFAFELLLGP
jgi:hypothetical protein